MSRYDLQVIDTIDTPDYIKGELSDEELDIPHYMIPPNPDDSESVLPSQIHPSYPYGNPTSIKHPSAKPRPAFDPNSRALFEDMGYSGAGLNGTLRWRDLALDELLPVDEQKEEAKRAAQARKMASGTSNNNPQGQQPPQAQAQPDQTIDEEDDDENDSDDEDNDQEDLDEELDDEDGNEIDDSEEEP
ncbi:hypothetical protein BJ165DRAFT_1337588 [Panaeolus papilionaceus]|nr:hypothetical protein BJ165DRAFT_1337588 [Panaeolus papilionaceus]